MLHGGEIPAPKGETPTQGQHPGPWPKIRLELIEAYGRRPNSQISVPLALVFP